MLYDYGQKSIQRLKLQTPPVIETLYDDSVYPALAQVSNIDVRDFGTEGRKYLLRKQFAMTFVGSQEMFTVLSDSDNDGNVNAIQAFTKPLFQQAPYSDWSQWKEFWRIE